MKEINLNKGYISIVDDEDFDHLSKFKWRVYVDRNTCYARRTIHKNKKATTGHMHREILSPKENMEVDHINGNGLDNRKINLRICSHSENTRNRKSNTKSVSKYKCVGWHKNVKKWYAAVNRKHVGYFDNEIDAAKAADLRMKLVHGEFARLNFP